MLDCLRRQIFCKSWKADGDVHIKVEKEESKDRSLRNAVFWMASPALLAVTARKDKTLVWKSSMIILTV